METHKYKLREFFTIGNGKDHSLLNEGTVPVYGSGGIMRYVDSYLYDGESVLLPRKGTLSNIQYVKGKFWTVDTCYYTIIDKNLIEPYYLYVLLKSLDLSGLDSGASIPSMTSKTYYEIRVSIPPIEQQKRVSKAIKEYDNLIEVNNKRIKILEQMAENLYKEWFVRFRFPGYETAEFENGKLGRIPSPFSIVKMQDVFDYYIGGGWGNDDEDKEFSVEAYVIRGTDFPRVSRGDISSCPLRYHKKNNYDARELKPDDIILEVSGGTSDQPVGRTLLVTSDVIEKLGGRVICASFCKQIRVNTEVVSPIYFFYWMQFLYEARIIDRFQLQSTGIINFQFEYFLRKGDLMLPTKEIMDSFESLIRPIHKEIASISKENANLIKQRDLLLPRLMSGKLGV